MFIGKTKIEGQSMEEEGKRGRYKPRFIVEAYS
jgi:hypothetical protein